MFAVITTGGKQYKVIEQDIIFVEKLDVEEGAEVTFPVAALSTDAGFKVGTPVVEGATVSGKVLKNGKAKKNEKKKIGHRQPFTKVQIVKIEG